MNSWGMPDAGVTDEEQNVVPAVEAMKSDLDKLIKRVKTLQQYMTQKN